MLDRLTTMVSLALLLSIISVGLSLYIVIKPLTEPVGKADFRIFSEPTIYYGFTTFSVQNNGTADASNVLVSIRFIAEGNSSVSYPYYLMTCYIPEVSARVGDRNEVQVPLGASTLNGWVPAAPPEPKLNYTLTIECTGSSPGGDAYRQFTYDTPYPTT